MPNRGFRLATIAGIEIALDWSLLIIFSLITFVLATAAFPAWHPEWSAGLVWGTALLAAVLFFASILVHELSHALVGRVHGIEVPRIVLFIFGGMAQMRSEPKGWRAEFYMAIVGPLTSLALGGLCLLAAGLITGPIEVDPQRLEQALAELSPTATLLMWLGNINIILGLFNLVPGFPLDGGRVLRAAIWGITGDLRRATKLASRAGQLFAWLLIATGVAMLLGVRVPVFGGGFVNGLWLALIGWFLNNAALTSYRQLLLHEALQDVTVARVMRSPVQSVAPELSVAAFIDDYLLGSDQRAFPVVEGELLVGLVCLDDARRTDKTRRANSDVRDIMTPRERIASVTPDADLADAMSTLAEKNINQLPVLDGDRVVGLLTREEVMKWLSLHGNSDIDGNRLALSRQHR